MAEEDFEEQNLQKLITLAKAPIAIAQKVATVERVDLTIDLKGKNSDGSPATAFSIVSLPNHGILKDRNGKEIKSQDLPYTLPDSQVKYKSTSASATQDSFTFKVMDGNLSSTVATVSIQIEGINNKPIATDQVATVDKGVSKIITLRGEDKEGDKLTYKITSLPVDGELWEKEKQIGTTDLSYSLSGNTVTYISESDSATSDKFTFVANDSHQDSDSGKVAINIGGTNSRPVIDRPKQPLTINEDASLTLELDDLDVTNADNSYPKGFTLTVSNGLNYSLVDNLKVVPDTDYTGQLSF